MENPHCVEGRGGAGLIGGLDFGFGQEIGGGIGEGEGETNQAVFFPGASKRVRETAREKTKKSEVKKPKPTFLW